MIAWFQAFRHVRAEFGQEQRPGHAGRRPQPQSLWAGVRRQDLLIDALGGVLLWRVSLCTDGILEFRTTGLPVCCKQKTAGAKCSQRDGAGDSSRSRVMSGRMCGTDGESVAQALGSRLCTFMPSDPALYTHHILNPSAGAERAAGRRAAHRPVRGGMHFLWCCPKH